jgi:ABC-type multidrug transport system, ATPase and permease components
MPELDFEEEEYSSEITMPVIRRIGGLLVPYWPWALGFVLAVALTSWLDSYFTYINKSIIDRGIMGRDTRALYQLVVRYGVLQVLQAVMVFSFIYLAGVLGERIRYDLRKRTFEHLQDLSLSYYTKQSVGRLIARVTSDSDRVAQLITWGLLDVVWAILNISTATFFR